MRIINKVNFKLKNYIKFFKGSDNEKSYFTIFASNSDLVFLAFNTEIKYNTDNSEINTYTRKIRFNFNIIVSRN